MINGFKRYETEMTTSNQEIIAINKSKLIDDISDLLAVLFIFGVSIGITIMQLIK